jgi:hypothetical protein
MERARLGAGLRGTQEVLKEMAAEGLLKGFQELRRVELGRRLEVRGIAIALLDARPGARNAAGRRVLLSLRIGVDGVLLICGSAGGRPER